MRIQYKHGHYDDMLKELWWGWVATDGEPWTWDYLEPLVGTA